MKWNLAMLRYRDKTWDIKRNLLGCFKLFPQVLWDYRDFYDNVWDR